ncbi:hypothetical protein [Paremcibacter congregatus]|uniref:hypothetical protein n=1 Tax=Paremcibacter congregatus TaxID=2043170 RepID=UPI0030ED857C|tara:strand:- start:828 stop:1034 length:207 start_codon:yes stop_codon:yes gene_type:complete
MEILLHATGLAFIPVIGYVIYLGFQDILAELNIDLPFETNRFFTALAATVTAYFAKIPTPDLFLIRQT